MGVDEHALRADLARGAFRSGVDRRRWRLIELEWPFLYVAVAAKPKPGAPAEYCFRFDCTGYRQAAPAGSLWDSTMRDFLAIGKWPGGEDRVAMAFNPQWEGGRAIYVGCDRVALRGHDPWLHQFPAHCWSPTSDITQYLELLYGLLHSQHYTGIRGS